jgi:hypothetical protein
MSFRSLGEYLNIDSVVESNWSPNFISESFNNLLNAIHILHPSRQAEIECQINHMIRYANDCEESDGTFNEEDVRDMCDFIKACQDEFDSNADYNDYLTYKRRVSRREERVNRKRMLRSRAHVSTQRVMNDW